MLAVLCVLLVGAATEAAIAFWRARQFCNGIAQPNALVEVADRQVSAADLAQAYEPVLVWAAGFEYPPVAIIWYVREQGEMVLLAYRVVREDERHPNRVIQLVYGLWRRVYFGSHRDIEYIELLVDRQSGAAQSIRFEKGEVQGTFVRHVPVELTLRDPERGLFARSGAGQEAPDLLGGTRGERLLFTVETWNGLFEVKESSPEAGAEQGKRLPLVAGDTWLTFRFRMWRRSAGWLARPYGAGG